MARAKKDGVYAKTVEEVKDELASYGADPL